MKTIMRRNKPMRILYIAGFFFSFHIALTAYINSSFLEGFISAKLIGILYMCSALTSIVALFLFARIRDVHPKNIMKVCLLVSTLLLIFLPLSHGIFTLAAFLIYYTINIIIYLSLDMNLELRSNNTTTGSTRGTYLTILNIAWLIAPAGASFLVGSFGFLPIYIIGACMNIFAFIVISQIKDIPLPVRKKEGFLTQYFQYFKNKNLRIIFFASFILQLFYSVMAIYLPLHLRITLGLPWTSISFIFFIMLIPFIILEIPLGRLADSRFGEKELLISGFLIAGGATLCIFFLPQALPVLIALVLFGTRIGAASIEIMSESYFFKQIDKEHTGAVSVFRNASPLAWTIGPLIASIILSFGTTFTLFGIVGCILLLSPLALLSLKDTQ